MTSGVAGEAGYRAAVLAIRKLLGQRQADSAAAACLDLQKQHPESVEPLLLLAKARQQQGRFDDMRVLAEDALAKDPRHRGAQLQFAEACIFCGQHDRALLQLGTLEAAARDDPQLLQHVAEFYAHCGKHTAAHRCYQRAAELEPDNPRATYNLASSSVAVGELELAEAAYSRVIDATPDDYDAWQNRSTLRKQSVNDNHVEELTRKLAALPVGDPGETPLAYALAKELEDIGEYERSFAALTRGASSRRRRMAYDVQNDIAVMARIRGLFNDDYAHSAPRAESRKGPIFVLGLPRSGTTLVDRIISSHSEVVSMGEINDFALCLTRLGKSVDKNQLLDASVAIDANQLGAAYLDSVNSYGREATLFIDKTPANYLYIGLLAKALPGAPIVHVQRHPMDSCLAMYRTLFRMGYPFSYDLDDLADYYIAYRELMAHWQRLFPDAILNVSYEQLVNDQERVSREIIAHCGLEFESTCLRFEQNRAPVATASAAQVRQPIYRDALERWRRYETQLAPLVQRLEAAGIAL